MITENKDTNNNRVRYANDIVIILIIIIKRLIRIESRVASALGEWRDSTKLDKEKIMMT